jgi:hypothetical protein
MWPVDIETCTKMVVSDQTQVSTTAGTTDPTQRTIPGATLLLILTQLEETPRCRSTPTMRAMPLET